MCCRRHRVTFQALIPSTPWVERKMGATAIRSDLPSVDYFVRRIKHFCYNLPIIGTIMCVLWCSGFPLQIMYCYRMRRDGNLKFKHWLRGGKKCIVCSRNFISFPAALPLRDHKLIDRLDGMISAGWNSLPDCGITRREFEKRVQEGSPSSASFPAQTGNRWVYQRDTRHDGQEWFGRENLRGVAQYSRTTNKWIKRSMLQMGEEDQKWSWRLQEPLQLTPA